MILFLLLLPCMSLQCSKLTDMMVVGVWASCVGVAGKYLINDYNKHIQKYEITIMVLKRFKYSFGHYIDNRKIMDEDLQMLALERDTTITSSHIEQYLILKEHCKRAVLGEDRWKGYRAAQQAFLSSTGSQEERAYDNYLNNEWQDAWMQYLTAADQEFFNVKGKGAKKLKRIIASYSERIMVHYEDPGLVGFSDVIYTFIKQEVDPALRAWEARMQRYKRDERRETISSICIGFFLGSLAAYAID